MTKQEFWRLIAIQLEHCEYCPVKIGDSEVECHHCSDALEEFYGRLERESNDDKVRKQFMTVVYDELNNDSDNCRANRIIDAADEYVEEIMRLERESK